MTERGNLLAGPDPGVIARRLRDLRRDGRATRGAARATRRAARLDRRAAARARPSSSSWPARDTRTSRRRWRRTWQLKVDALQRFDHDDVGQLRADVDVLLNERRQQEQAKNAPVDWAALTEDQAAAQWPILARWVAEVLVARYELTRDELPDCWALHLPVVAELSWLRTAYVEAYLTRSSPADGRGLAHPVAPGRADQDQRADQDRRVRSRSAHAAERPGGQGRSVGRRPAACAAGGARMLVAVLRPRLPPGPGAAPGPGCGGGVRLVPGLGERLTSPAVQVRSPRRQLMSSRSDAMAR